jgi:hypothetical protein
VQSTEERGQYLLCAQHNDGSGQHTKHSNQQ